MIVFLCSFACLLIGFAAGLMLGTYVDSDARDAIEYNPVNERVAQAVRNNSPKKKAAKK